MIPNVIDNGTRTWLRVHGKAAVPLVLAHGVPVRWRVAIDFILEVYKGNPTLPSEVGELPYDKYVTLRAWARQQSIWDPLKEVT